MDVVVVVVVVVAAAAVVILMLSQCIRQTLWFTADLNFEGV